jgi:hypothetical protein
MAPCEPSKQLPQIPHNPVPDSTESLTADANLSTLVGGFNLDAVFSGAFSLTLLKFCKTSFSLCEAGKRNFLRKLLTFVQMQQ